METLSASEIGKGLDAHGKVAIYGILFDGQGRHQAREQGVADQIGALLKQQASLCCMWWGTPTTWALCLPIWT